MKRKERKIKNMLNSYDIPKHDEDAPMKLIKFIHENSLSISKIRTSNKQFILSQIGFIRKRTWALQIIILGMLCLCFYKMGSENPLSFRNFSLMSILAPLLLIIKIDEISRIYNKSMLELEFSTKNSLKKVLVTRMVILGITDCIALGVMIIFLGKLIDISILRVIMYILVPFNIMCIGCMQLMKYFKGKSLNYCCVIYSALLMAILNLGRINDLGIYAQEFIWKWVFIYIITTVIFVFEIKKMWKRLSLFDEVIKEVII